MQLVEFTHTGWDHWQESTGGDHWQESTGGDHWQESTGGDHWQESTGGDHWQESTGGDPGLREHIKAFHTCADRLTVQHTNCMHLQTLLMWALVRSVQVHKTLALAT